MSPQEKAKELVDKYRTYIRMADKYEYNLSKDEIYLAKRCALIAVDEVLKDTENIYFWHEVKSELEAL